MGKAKELQRHLTLPALATFLAVRIVARLAVEQVGGVGGDGDRRQAGERCFQLLTQVSGRAGRRAKQGRVIIQTNHPQHPVLQDIVQQDYEQMYHRELIERKQFLYPPYVRLVRIILKHGDRDLVGAAASTLARTLQAQLGQGVLGPQKPLIAKVKNKYLMDIWVKIKKDAALASTKKLLQQAGRRILLDRSFKQVKLLFDVDPM